MPNQSKQCPGCGKDYTPRWLVACFKCWPKLPKRLRMRIRLTNPGGAARQDAIDNAQRWLRERRR